jgi:hypothetical protein
MKFRLNAEFLVDTDEAPWKTEGLRIGLFGGSGSGKSNTAALLAEQFLSQGGAVVIFEPRAEYQTLKEKFDIVVCGGPYAKDIDFIPTSPSTYAKAVVEEGVSLIFYTTDVEDETKLIEFVSRFLHYLLKYNETVKRPIMLIVEETQEYAPSSTKGRVSQPWVFSRMIKSFKTASIDARKLNIVPIALSPRPQEVNFTIRQLCNLTFYGKFSPQDAHYIESQCLKYYKDEIYRAEDLLFIKTGEFIVIGQKPPLQTITQPRLTKHGAETPKLTYIAPHKEETKKAVDSLTKTITEALERERREKSELEKAKHSIKALEEEVAEAWKEVDKYKQTADTLGKIKIELPEKKTVDITFIDKVRSDTARELKEKVMTVFDAYTPSFPMEKTTETDDIYKTWAPKMPSLCAKRLLKFLLENKGAKYSKSQLSVALGYKNTAGGVWGQALTFLKQNNLIKTDGKFLWCE